MKISAKMIPSTSKTKLTNRATTKNVMEVDEEPQKMEVKKESEKIDVKEEPIED